jgi:hypothetical protein
MQTTVVTACSSGCCAAYVNLIFVGISGKLAQWLSWTLTIDLVQLRDCPCWALVLVMRKASTLRSGHRLFLPGAASIHPRGLNNEETSHENAQDTPDHWRCSLCVMGGRELGR